MKMYKYLSKKKKTILKTILCLLFLFHFEDHLFPFFAQTVLFCNNSLIFIYVRKLFLESIADFIKPIW